MKNGIGAFFLVHNDGPVEGESRSCYEKMGAEDSRRLVLACCGVGRALVHGLRAGTFDEVRRVILSNGAPPNQVKVPRVVRDPSQLQCLARGLISPGFLNQ